MVMIERDLWIFESEVTYWYVSVRMTLSICGLTQEVGQAGWRRPGPSSPRSVTESSYGDVFFFRIFLRPGIMFVSLYVVLSVPLFKQCGWGARFIIIFIII